jgi:hypothetical protein
VIVPSWRIGTHSRTTRIDTDISLRGTLITLRMGAIGPERCGSVVGRQGANDP